MTKKEYLQDRLWFIITYYAGVILSMIVLGLDNLNNGYFIRIHNIIYALIIATIFIVILLILDYKKKSNFYDVIESSIENPQDLQYIFNLPEDIGNEYRILKDSYMNNYRYYIDKIGKLDERNKLQIEFNNRWIHEMKTPVSVIKLILEKEKEENNLKVDTYESLEEELNKLLNGLEMALYTLRINEFEKDFKVQDVELLATIRKTINENKSSFIMNSVFPKVLFNEEIVVKSDPKWVKFIMNQILNNSVKYTRVKNIDKKEILIDLEDNDDYIVVSIKDNGVGINKGDINRIFDPFFTGENGRRYLESTGMGLYLVKEVVDRLGHKIEVRSNVGEGSEFRLIFFKGKSIYNI